jgi:RNA polymerase sigma-70 factor (ECF subfamily)
MSLNNDTQIIKNILAGDVKGYAVLVNKYKNLAFTLAFRILCNREDAEEVAQDAFIKAYKNLAGFRSESAFSTWLYRIIFNTAVSRKRIKKQHFVTLDQLSSSIEEPELPKYDFDAVIEPSVILEKAMLKLSEEDRVIISLYYLNENGIDEIHTITGLSKSNVKVKLFRARKKLQEFIKEMSEKIVY